MSLEEVNYHFRKDKEENASIEISHLKAAKILAENKILGAEINISGLKIGISNHDNLINLIEDEIKEIEKFLRGEENLWE